MEERRITRKKERKKERKNERTKEEGKRVKPEMITDFEFANDVVLLVVIDQAQKLLTRV